MSARDDLEHRATYVWHDGALAEAPLPTGPVLAADSWLVDDGRVLAYDLHVERFAAAVATQGGDEEAAVAAMRALPAAVPDAGRWFPRVDAIGDAILAHVRPAPPRSRSAILVTADLDPRSTPGIKGPDLARSLDVRAAAEARGANEAIVLAADGSVVDGTTSAILWWRDDTLMTPPPDEPRVDSVTARAAHGIALALGVLTEHERARPEDLAGCEVWVASALHGIRGVARWLDGPPVRASTSADAWHARLDAMRRPWT